jgi:salicylate hydroxylase
MPGMRDERFLIVGGGIAGLAASLGLARAGKPSLILERAPAFEEMGAGLQLTPNAIHALNYLGAWEGVARRSIAPSHIEVRDGHTGRILQRVELEHSMPSRYGAPYRVASRPDLLASLVDAAQGEPLIELRAEAEVVDVSIADAAVTLRSGERLRHAALIGADGARSIVRRRLQRREAPQSSEHMHFRRMLPEGAADEHKVVIWLCRGGHLVHYPVCDGRLNMVASLSAGETEASPCFDAPCKALETVLALPGAWSRWPPLAHASDPEWHAQSALLIGDAAHASLPYLAQGAAMALEDACVLSQQLADGTDVSMAFATFTRLRYPRTMKLQHAAERSGQIYHASGAARLARNMALIGMGQSLFLRRLDWIYGWKP